MLTARQTPADMASLLDDIYECAQTGGGTFAAVFSGKISQKDCQSMITYLTRNEQPGLLRGGLPDGTQIAHKHGWTDNADQTINVLADAGVIYSPGGNYILSVYTHSDQQIIWDSGNLLLANISRAVYNYFNLTSQ